MRTARISTALVLVAAALLLSACVPEPGADPPRSPRPSSSRPSPSPSPDPLPALSLEQRVGQLFIVGSPATSADPDAIAAVRDRHVGGVFLGGRSTAGTQATAAVAAALGGASTDGIPVIVSTDQEGGQVQVLRGPGFDAIPSPVVQGTMTPDALRASARTWGAQLRAAGVTLDLAPVADVVPAGTESANPPIGALDRQFGSDATSVEQHAAAFAAGLRDAGVGATAKHFPGLGGVTANTDTTAGVQDAGLSASSPGVRIYARLADSGVDAVMLSTAVYPRIDGDNPAAFSPAVVALLRGPLGFDGILVTDDVSAARQVGSIPEGDRAIRAIAAGVDLVLVSHTPGIVGGMIDAVVARARADPAFASQVDAAARRVLAWKSAHLAGDGG